MTPDIAREIEARAKEQVDRLERDLDQAKVRWSEAVEARQRAEPNASPKPDTLIAFCNARHQWAGRHQQLLEAQKHRAGVETRWAQVAGEEALALGKVVGTLSALVAAEGKGDQALVDKIGVDRCAVELEYRHRAVALVAATSALTLAGKVVAEHEKRERAAWEQAEAAWWALLGFEAELPGPRTLAEDNRPVLHLGIGQEPARCSECGEQIRWRPDNQQRHYVEDRAQWLNAPDGYRRCLGKER